jgi:hypothetical protein
VRVQPHPNANFVEQPGELIEIEIELVVDERDSDKALLDLFGEDHGT